MDLLTDHAEILRTWQVFSLPGEVREVRIPKAGRFKTISGYFNNPTDFVKWVEDSGNDAKNIFPGYYFTINPVKPNLMARTCNRFKLYADITTSDADILALHWLLVDLDPIRPAGISSTEEEHTAAIELASAIKQWLIEEMNWPKNAFVRADSGNGGHLVARIDLPNDEASRSLIKKSLEALNAIFSNDKVKVDTTTFNPARIWKIYGTKARKGDSTSERPHRMARLLEVPEALDIVSKEKLDALANRAPKADAACKKNDLQTDKNRVGSPGSGFDPKQYAQSHGATVIRVDSWTDPEGGKWELAILAECPFDSSHNRGEARVGVRSDGKRTFRCFHDSCKGKNWQALRGLWEPGWKDRASKTKMSALEEALLFIAERCDGAHSTDGQGFNKNDAAFGQAMAEKVRAGQDLTGQEYKDVYAMLRTYNKNQLVPAGRDLRLIPRVQPKAKDSPKEAVKAAHSAEAIAAARDILVHKDPIRAHLDYVSGKIYGGEKPARAIILAAYSAYLSADDRLHVDAVGSSQSGKSSTVTAVLNTFPEENVIVTSEASPKSLYYLAQENPERLKDTIVYIDDARPEHIPVLKTFRNEGNITPRNLTVSDGEVLELIVQYRPVVLASSVTPLRDMEQQATSRTFLISIRDATPEEEKKIREAIRQQARMGAILWHGVDKQIKVLRAMAATLRDEGVREVLVPFDAEEPTGADRRGTGQFQRLIKISAFINQYQRPILEFNDGRRFVLAIPEDLEIAAEIWFDFAEGQEFKVSARALEVLQSIPSYWPGKTAPMLSKDLGRGQRSIERYLEDLYESGIVSRERITAPGMPWGYWCEIEMRQKVLSQIPDAENIKSNNVKITTEKFCRKYVQEKLSDSLIDSYINFFSNSDIIKKEMYRGIKYQGNLLDEESPEKIYTYILSQKSCRYSQKVASDSEIIATSAMTLFSKKPQDSDFNDVAITPKNVAIPSGIESKTIKAELQQAEEARAAEEAHDRELGEKYSGAGPTDQKSAADGQGQGETASKETEISRFLSALGRLLKSNPGLIQSIDGRNASSGSVIGKWTEEGLFLQPAETLKELSNIGAFPRQPSIEGITQALNEKKFLIIAGDGHLKCNMRFNGARSRGWYIKAEAILTISEGGPTDKPDSTKGGPTNQAGGPSGVPTNQAGVSTDKSDGSEGGPTNQAGGPSGVPTNQAGVSTDKSDGAEGGPTDQPGVSSGGPTDKSDGAEDGPTNQAGFSRRPEAKHSKLDPTALETVRIVKPEGYRTQIPHPENPNKFIDRLYSAGEIVEIQHWKAKDLIERHIAEPVGRAEA